MFSRLKTATGFYVAEAVLYGVCLTRSGATVTLREAVSVPMSKAADAALLGGNDGRAAVAAALGEACGILPEPRGAVFVGLGHGGFLLKSSPLLHLAPRRRVQRRDNREHMLWEAEQFLGEERSLYAVETVALGGQGFVVAARLAVLDLYERVFADAGLGDVDLDIVPFALYNCAEAAGLLAADAGTVLVGLSPGGADVLVASGGRLAGTGHYPGQGEDISELAEVIRQVLERTAVWRGHAVAAEHVWVAGPGATDVCLRLRPEMSCPCERMPWYRLVEMDDPGNDDGELAVAAGLALRGLYP